MGRAEGGREKKGKGGEGRGRREERKRKKRRRKGRMQAGWKAWCHRSVILAPRKLRQEKWWDFGVSLGYT